MADQPSSLETVDMSDFWQSRRVFVTGATGMVGSWLVKKLLKRGASVTALVLDTDPQSELYRSGIVHDVTVVNGRLEDLGTLERAISTHETELIVHLGAQAIVPVAQRSPLLTFESNIRGTYNLLEAARLHQDVVRGVVIASSDKVYGAQEHQCDESTAFNSRHPYEVSKSCTELLAKSYAHSYGLPLALTRCGNIYGGGDLNWSRIIPGTIRAFLAEEPPIIRSNGQFLREYLYAEDAADAYLTLAEQLHRPEVQGEAFNFSPESPIKVLDLVALIARLMSCDAIKPVILNQAEGEIPVQSLSAEKAQRVLGWSTNWTLEEGLRETIAWYRTFLATPMRSVR